MITPDNIEDHLTDAAIDDQVEVEKLENMLDLHDHKGEDGCDCEDWQERLRELGKYGF